MKLLLFTVLCSFTGLLLAGNYASSDGVEIEPSDLSLTCAMLSSKADYSDTDDMYSQVDEYRQASSIYSYPSQSYGVHSIVVGEIRHSYRTRAPPVSA
jgi:hypothetical protein